ncbi:hypothetical protein T4B_8554 [Trichinella pseudospiralis]|uniref:Uncharacterized protein n=2 Tax=Trichinella pseudospiralis TaxID=6337 RepID=A0A0V1FTR3_TRIPS|nr:hypothetical protein T4D_12288 [Trichinella pseudospiralis]KRZ23632.1 hypothetical protein T4B_8554 [Trichinella pseudospiralis]KRZ35645.1 hypothetical protein T4C_6001 [Trichinella pseudospiralis]
MGVLTLNFLFNQRFCRRLNSRVRRFDYAKNCTCAISLNKIETNFCLLIIAYKNIYASVQANFHVRLHSNLSFDMVKSTFRLNNLIRLLAGCEMRKG